ncbi:MULTISPECIES: sigma-70 family RNA polymerase sigma factor [Stenotrophomonas]|uniref:RNA polymerase sigma factor n=1 Tax=Stenotrophomonas TaxID=40323 RepID=UPI0007704149|nr:MULTISPECIES: sigma-70 family RNA polymerase sigma factor [Stenotrophomonas]AMJ56475.1 RNA polymerase subunit sigma-24 [Stenotrophomonas sp. KCTC 12332]
MTDPQLQRLLDTLWRMESPRLVARLACMLGDLDSAEELAQDALVAALEHWPEHGIPDNPAAWLMATAQRRAIDRLRQRRLHAQRQAQVIDEQQDYAMGAEQSDHLDDIGDDLLRLVFVACHPALPADARVALTLRLLCGLSTHEIARAYLQPEPTIAQRIVRAKRLLAERKVAFEVPRRQELPQRLQSVLDVVYLVFNEGYAASSGEDWVRPALCEEALRLGRVLSGLLPDTVAVLGLLALMELQASRLRARVAADGAAVLLLDQDRSRWDWLQIARGQAALAQAITLGGADDAYVLQAGIAACHARARQAEQTDWHAIAALYGRLLEVMPSPVVELNRVVAVAQAQGAAAAWPLLQHLLDDPQLQGYAPLQAVRADLLARLGRAAEARQAFEHAAALSANAREREALLARAAAVH